MHKSKAGKIQGRHGARYMALQALYAWSMGARLSEVKTDLLAKTLVFSEDTEVEPAVDVSCDAEYFQALVQGVVTQQNELNALLAPHLDRPMEEITPIEQALLWIGIYELANHPETPHKVIINEAILLAKQFGAQDGHKYINGVLDKAAKLLRTPVQEAI